jgi:hypothetical protein
MKTKYVRNQIKRIRAGLLLSIIVMAAPAVSAETLQEYLNKIAGNAAKIKTEIAIGTMNVRLTNEKNEVINNISKDLTLYLKSPNMIKIMIAAGTENSDVTITQVGNVFNQRVGSTGPVVTKTVNEQSDLFQKYLGFGIEKILTRFHVTSEKTLDDSIIEYVLLPNDSSFVIEKYVLRINKTTGMNVYESYYSKGKQVVEILKEYFDKDGIFALKKMTLRTRQSNMIMENIFEYRTIDLNMKLLDKEFEM